MKKLSFLVLLICFSCVSQVAGQTIFDWINTTDGNFRQGAAVNRWFDNVLLTNLQDEPTGSGIILRFNNNNQLANSNNVPGTYSVYHLLFGSSNTTARTISGNPIRLQNYLGVNPRIENQSSATHIINANLEGDGNVAYPLEINPVAGNLTIGGAINNQGSPVNILGGTGRILNLNGIISGTGNFELRQNTQYFPGATNTYTGTTTVTSGIAYAGTNIIASTNGSFGNHASGLFLNGGEIKSNTATFSRPITVTATNSFLDAYGSARLIASDITMPSGTMNLNVGGFYSPNLSGQDLTLSGSISNTTGTLSLTKISTSSVILSGANSFSGSLTIQMGSVTINNAASVPATCNLILSGGTFRVGSVASSSVINAANLSMTANSAIDLGTNTNPFTLIFANSGPTFTGTLTINNWSAANGKKIRVTNTTHIATVLGQINFAGYGTGAQIVNGDELWPATLFVTQNTGAGNFSNTASWVGGVVPPANSNIYVQSGFALTIDGSYSLRSIDVSGTLSCTGNHTTTLGNSYSKISNSGVINFSAGTILLNSAGGYIDGTSAISFNNLILNGAFVSLRSPAINGTVQMNSGSSFSGSAPNYGPASTLIYNSGAQFNRNVEWNSNAGAGYPVNVVITNNTEVRCEVYPTSGFGCSGDVTINAGSHLNMTLVYLQPRIGGNLTINGTLSLSGGIAPGATLFLSGNWVRSATGVVNFNNPPFARTVQFEGATNTSITGPVGQTENFPYLTVFKGVNNTLTLNSPVHIISGLILSFGKIISTTANILSLGDLASPASGSVNSFVSGPVKKVGRNFPSNVAYTFPVGRIVGAESHYRPLTISPPTNALHEYTAEFFRADPYNQGPISAAAKAAGLQRISRCEYWDLTKSSGASNVSVTLTWSSNPAGASRCNTGAYVMNLSGIVAVQYNGSEWGDIFGGTPSGTNANGQVLWTGASLYNKFVLGSNTTELNPLPFNVLKFEGRSRTNDIELNFTVTGNLGQKEYLLERSNDGIHFFAVETVEAQINVAEASYISYDRKPFSGLNYYRLTAFDWLGKFEQSKTIQVWRGKVFQNPAVFPNPVAGNVIQLYTNGLKKGNYQVQLSSVDGRVLLRKSYFIEADQPLLFIPVPSNVAKGVYWLTLSGERAGNYQFKIIY